MRYTTTFYHPETCKAKLYFIQRTQCYYLFSRHKQQMNAIYVECNSTLFRQFK